MLRLGARMVPMPGRHTLGCQSMAMPRSRPRRAARGRLLRRSDPCEAAAAASALRRCWREQAELLDEVAARRSELDEAESAAAAARRAWLRSVRAARSKYVVMDAIADVSGVTRAAVYQNLERARPSRARS